MDFIQWWFEKHYVLSLICTPGSACIYSFYKEWYDWAALSVVVYLVECLILSTLFK